MKKVLQSRALVLDRFSHEAMYVFGYFFIKISKKSHCSVAAKLHPYYPSQSVSIWLRIQICFHRDSDQQAYSMVTFSSSEIL